MQNKQVKRFGIVATPELHYKLHYIARYEGRSANKQVLYLIRQCIKNFEMSKGEIVVPKTSTDNTNEKQR